MKNMRVWFYTKQLQTMEILAQENDQWMQYFTVEVSLVKGVPVGFEPCCTYYTPDKPKVKFTKELRSLEH